MNKIRHPISALLGLLALAILATGCSGPEPAPRTVSPLQTPTTEPTEPATRAPTPPPTATPEPREAPPPTATPEPTATAQPTAIPSPQPYPTPEWTPYAGEPFTVVFMRDSDLWASEVGGRGEWRLTNECIHTDEGRSFGVTGFDVSPDGRYVAYVVHDQRASFVKVVDVLDGNTRLLSPADGSYGVVDYGRTGPQAWWDETHVAYYGSELPGTSEGRARSTDLVIVDLETGQRTVEPVPAVQWPSPDGRYVLSGFVLHDRETGEQWEVFEEGGHVAFVGWSPASRLMLFSVVYAEEETEVGKETERLLVVDAETRDRRAISPEDRVAYGVSAAWSPDGQTIAYMQCDPPRTGCGNPELWLSSPDGAHRRRIPMEESMHFTRSSWTPDGSRLVFETTRGIWSVRIDGTDLRPIAHGYRPQVLQAP